MCSALATSCTQADLPSFVIGPACIGLTDGTGSLAWRDSSFSDHEQEAAESQTKAPSSLTQGTFHARYSQWSNLRRTFGTSSQILPLTIVLITLTKSTALPLDSRIPMMLLRIAVPQSS